MKTKLKLPEALAKNTEPIDQIEPISTELEQASNVLLDSVLQTQDHMPQYYESLLHAENPEITDVEVRQKLDSYKRAATNMKKAHLVTTDIVDELSARWSDLRNSQKRKLIPSAPANAVIDDAESRSNHFARGLNAYKLLLLCFIGSFLGVVVELGWCLLTRGHLESRSGLVYGPFNLLYGVGAVVLTVSLYRFRNRGKWLSFIGGTLVGSIVEYVCSWAQEMAFGSRSWDYSTKPFNLNGRILPYVFPALGIARRLLGQEHISAHGEMDSQNPQPRREDSYLGTYRFLYFQRRRDLHCGLPLVGTNFRCSGKRRVLAVYRRKVHQ